MATKTQIREGIQRIQIQLNSIGWVNLFNARSGILWKNGCILVMGTDCDYTKEPQFPCDLLLTFVNTPSVMTSPQSWYIERAGKLLAMGTLTSSVLDYVGQCKKENGKITEYQRFMEKVEYYATFTDEQANALAYSWQELHTPASGKKLIPVNDTVLHTGFFRINSNFLEAQGIAPGSLWMLGGKSGSSDSMVLVFREVVAINHDIRSINEGQTLDLTLSELQMCEQKRLLTAMQIANDMYSDVTRVLTKPENMSVVAIPKGLRKFSKSSAQLHAMSLCIASVSNVTPLLYQGICSAGKSLIHLNTIVTDCSCLSGAILDESGASDLEFILKNKLDLNRFATCLDSSQYLRYTLEEFISSADEYLESFDLSANDHAIATALFSSGVALTDEDSVLVAYAKLYGEQTGTSAIIQELITKGIHRADCIMMSFGDVVNKVDVLQFFRFDGLSIRGHKWSDVLLQCLDRFLYVYFDFEHGLTFSMNGGKIGRDFNSLIIYNNAYASLFRGVCINEEVVCYGFSDAFSSFAGLLD